jgi:hypothetical protein
LIASCVANGIGCVVNFGIHVCTIIIVADYYYCPLCEFALEAMLFSNIFKKIKIINFRRLTIANRSYSPVTSIG